MDFPIEWWNSIFGIMYLLASITLYRQDRNEPNAPNTAYYSEYEKHNAEIAAFHVDRYTLISIWNVINLLYIEYI